MSSEFLKDYIQVNERIMKFYEKYPEGSIQTEILFIDNEKVVMKAYAHRDKQDLKPSTGHAEEIRNSNYINRTSAVENCETSAVGRALANLGFEIKHSIASKEEVERAIQKQEFYKQVKILAPEKEKKQVFSKAKDKGISNEEFKSICERITKKGSSKEWTLEDIDNIKTFINSQEYVQEQKQTYS